MSTLTITTPRGAKVRTQSVGYRYFVVIETFGDYDFQRRCWLPEGEQYVSAKLIKRTNSAVAALHALDAWSHATVYRHSPSADPDRRVMALTREEILDRAQNERQAKKFASSVANNGPARSLWY